MARNEQGDTLVEVLLAIVILGVVIVGATTIMSRGLASAQLSIEHSQVRQYINGQTDMLEYLRDSFVENPSSFPGTVWRSLVNGSSETASTYDTNCTPSKPGVFMEEQGGEIVATSFDPSNKPLVAATPGQGLWVEATRSNSSIKPAYMDFVVRACWQGANSAGQQQTVTAVRLYDPSR